MRGYFYCYLRHGSLNIKGWARWVGRVGRWVINAWTITIPRFYYPDGDGENLLASVVRQCLNNNHEAATTLAAAVRRLALAQSKHSYDNMRREFETNISRELAGIIRNIEWHYSESQAKDDLVYQGLSQGISEVCLEMTGRQLTPVELRGIIEAAEAMRGAPTDPKKPVELRGIIADAKDLRGGDMPTSYEEVTGGDIGEQAGVSLLAPLRNILIATYELIRKLFKSRKANCASAQPRSNETDIQSYEEAEATREQREVSASADTTLSGGDVLSSYEEAEATRGDIGEQEAAGAPSSPPSSLSGNIVATQISLNRSAQESSRRL